MLFWRQQLGCSLSSAKLVLNPGLYVTSPPPGRSLSLSLSLSVSLSRRRILVEEAGKLFPKRRKGLYKDHRNDAWSFDIHLSQASWASNHVLLLTSLWCSFAACFPPSPPFRAKKKEEEKRGKNLIPLFLTPFLLSSIIYTNQKPYWVEAIGDWWEPKDIHFTIIRSS